jgi:hypothetical protein
MHLRKLRVALVAGCWLSACETTPDPRRDDLAQPDEMTEPGEVSDAPLVAGGETSEFSGGEVAFGYCPVIESRTELDLGRDDVAAWVALAAGHHDVSLRWQREFPDEAVRGFEERTRLLLDVEVLSAEDVVCVSNPDDTGYETSGYRAQLRRLELSVALSTADGALQRAFRGTFLVAPSDTRGGLYLAGGERFPTAELEGTLELGVDPELAVAESMMNVHLAFGEQGVSGALTPWVILPGPYNEGGGRPSWTPVRGDFPAPDEGCRAGVVVPLDEIADGLGDTPRAAYDLARASLPTAPVTAAWEDASQGPPTLTWTELSLRPGAATHACNNGGSIDVYAPLGLESADGRLLAEYPVVANVSLSSARAGQPRSATDLTLSVALGWALAEDFPTLAGMDELDLGLADYGSVYLYQSFRVAGDELRGQLHVTKWENHVATSAELPSLSWCAGSGCEREWCARTSPDDGSCSEL